MALKNIRVIELAGLAPSPFCGLILSDFGADVIRIDRIGGDPLRSILTRGKRSLQVDLKRKEGIQTIEKLCTRADVLIEPFRAGVMEKMGLGPSRLLELNRGLVYARLSGFGQNGPLSKLGGHDINYLAVSGVLSLLGPPRPGLPSPPINFLADFAGGGLMCALGICMALLERASSGLGQVIDSNMTEGASYLSSWIHATKNNPSFAPFLWSNSKERGKNLLDGGAPFYSVYRTKDDKYMALGALEPQFFAKFVEKMGIDGDKYSPGFIDEAMRQELETIFQSKTQQEWVEIFDGVDACVTPVVDYDEAANYPHNKVNQSFLADGSPRPAPRLDRTPANPILQENPIPDLGRFLQENCGVTPDEAKSLIENNIVAVPRSPSKL